MDLLREAIKSSLEKYPEFDEFLVATELAADKKQSLGTRLDAAKSVYESVVKSMLGHLDKSRSRKQLDVMTLTEASRRLLGELSRYEGVDLDADFIESMTEVVKRFSITRNNTGDISHGHVAPKDNSTEHFVKLAVTYVESTCVYLFELFMDLDLSYELPERYDAETNNGFNDYLDDIHGPVGQVLYSKALYQLDYESWVDEKERYESDLGNEA